ncbi:hypothetical protein PR048_007944 [Dryococelus australis]|uniref:Uncharacterized protein n=1 Tax=Dryococelus australis TaxID=614101 RepID=A0ABQ9HVN7_9NEOP|nr:hypothetical protein PR048_007944 [Dryococelus australis]
MRFTSLAHIHNAARRRRLSPVSADRHCASAAAAVAGRGGWIGKGARETGGRNLWGLFFVAGDSDAGIKINDRFNTSADLQTSKDTSHYWLHLKRTPSTSLHNSLSSAVRLQKSHRIPPNPPPPSHFFLDPQAPCLSNIMQDRYGRNIRDYKYVYQKHAELNFLLWPCLLRCDFYKFLVIGAAVAEWFHCLPPIKVKRVKSFGRATPGFSQVGIPPDDSAGRRVFSGIFRFPVLAFRRCSIITSLHTHRLSRPHW